MSISLSDVRYRSHQEGDVPNTYPGQQTNKTVGPHKVYIDNVKYRSHQNVVWFEDDIAAAPNIPFDGRSGMSITGALTRRFTDSWEGYGLGTGWAKFKAPYSGQYILTIEKLDGAATTIFQPDGDPENGFVPNVEIWLPFTDETPTSYDDIDDFPGFAWPFDPPDNFNLIAGRTYYILVYGFHLGPGLGETPIEEDGSFVITLVPFSSAGTANAPQNFFSSAGVLIPPRGWIGGQNVNSTKESSLEPLHPQGSGKTVWFLFQTVHLGLRTVRIQREWGAEHTLSAYSAPQFPNVGNLTPLVHSTSTPAEITFNTVSVANYYIQVDSKDNQEGGFILEWDMPEPPGNRLSDPVDLGNSASLTLTGQTTHGADADVTFEDFPNHRNGAGEEDVDTQYDGDVSTVWYEWEAPSDGWTTFSTTPSPNMTHRLAVFSGDTYEELIQRGQGTIGAGTRTVDWPVKQGNKYKIRVNSFDNGMNFSLSLNHNPNHTPINFSSPGEFSHSSEGTFTRFPIYTPGNPYAKKSLYISFRVKYGNANHITPGGDSSIFWGRILNGNLQTLINLSNNQSARSWRLGDDVIVAQSLEGNHMTQDWTRVEITCHFESFGISFYVNGRHIGSEGSNDFPPIEACYLDLGLLQDDLHRGTSIVFKDVIIRDIWNRDFDYKPEPYPNSAHYVKNFEGYSHGLGKTNAGDAYEDWGGYSGDSTSVLSRHIAVPCWWSRGIPENTSRGRAVRVAQGSYVHPSLTNFTSTFSRNGSLVNSFGVWMYLESYATVGLGAKKARGLVGLSGAGEPGPTISTPAMYIENDGNLYVQGFSGFRKYLKRRMDLGRWHYLEIIHDNRHPVLIWKIYLNDELIYEGTPNPWFPVTNSETSQPAPAFMGIGPTGSLITDMVWGWGFEGQIGPYKTALIKPNSSVDLVHLNSAGVGWWKSEDDGLNITELTLGDNPHTYIDQWPFIRGFEGTPAPIRLLAQDFTFNTGAISYVEVGFEDMPAGEIPVAIKSLEAVRGWDKPLVNDYESEGASDADLMIGLEIVSPGNSNRVSRGVRYFTGEADHFNSGTTTLSQEALFLYDYGEVPWTESSVNAITARWGFGGGGFAGAGDYGCVLNALAFEVLMRDTYPPLAPYATLQPPHFEWNVPFTGGTTSNDPFPPFEGISQTSCDAYDKRRAPVYPQSQRLALNAVDPYIRGKVLLWLNMFYSSNDFEYPKDTIFIYWRLVPGYDKNYPGFDGDFHDTDEDRANGTTSNDMLVRWTGPFGYDWNGSGRFRGTPDYPPHREVHKTKPLDGDTYTYFYMNLEYPTLLYDPCFDREKGKLTSEGEVTIEAYAKDAWGNSSATRSFTFTFPRGNCCGHIVVPLKYRAKQVGDV